MPLTGDIVEFVAKGRFLDQAIVSVHHYLCDGVTEGSEASSLTNACTAWRDLALPILTAVQVSSSIWNEVYAKNLTDPTEVAQVAAFVPGARQPTIATIGPPFVAYAITANVNSNVVRKGSKRIPGTDEAVFNEGGEMDLAFLAELREAARAYYAPLIYDINAATWSVNQIGIWNGVNPGYRPIILGVNALGQKDLSRFAYVSDVGAGEYVTTQNTRKRGRGK